MNVLIKKTSRLYVCALLLCFFSASSAFGSARSASDKYKVASIPSTTAGDTICTLKAPLRGDPSYFWRWGRDAWEGTGQLKCAASQDSLSVRVIWNSWESGYGASAEHQLEFMIENIPTEKLESLFGTYRTYRPSVVNSQQLKSPAQIFAVAETVRWPVRIEALREGERRFAEAVNFGLLTIRRSDATQLSDLQP